MEGVPLAWAISWLPSVGWQIIVIAVLFAIGIPIATAAGKALGGSKDNQAIIWDEIVTVPVVFLLVPLTNWKIALAGFLLHRLFDITKPPPAHSWNACQMGRASWPMTSWRRFMRASHFTGWLGYPANLAGRCWRRWADA